jgi:hypothetical protein
MLRTIKNIPALRRWYYTRNAPIELVRFRPDLAQAVKINRQSLSMISRWLDDDVYRASIFHYGLPPHIRPFIDNPIDNSPTYSDLVVHLARGIQGLRYLELGPSVGKNLFQVASAVQNAELVAVDIEDINPTLERQLVRRDQTAWATMAGSKRSAASTQSVYVLGTNRVEYIAGDLFDPATWERLRGRRFNVIFSDAFHSPEALLMEWEQICKLDLLAAAPFAMIWDDLSSAGMRSAFYRIASAIRRDRPSAVASLEVFQGWVGKHEGLHPIGIVRGPNQEQ